MFLQTSDMLMLLNYFVLVKFDILYCDSYPYDLVTYRHGINLIILCFSLAWFCNTKRSWNMF